MESKICNTRHLHLLCLAGAVALAPSAAIAVHAEQPTPARAALHRISSVQAQPESGLPEGQSTPTPPTPPNPNSFKDDLFAGTEKFAKNASDATEVNMDPDSLNLVGGAEASRAHRTLLSVVRSYSYDKPGMYNMADVEEFRRKLETGDWHCSVHTRDMKTGESTDVCSKRRGADLIENAIITVSPKSLTFIHNIRRANGQGGHLHQDDFPGVSALSGLPLQLSMQVMQPVMHAQMLASTAEMRSTMPVMHADMLAATAGLRSSLPELQMHLEQLNRDMPAHLRDMQKQTQALALRSFAQQRLALQHQLGELQRFNQPAISAMQRQQQLLLQRELRELQVPVPPVPPAPSAPGALAAPAAPTAPETPAPPPVPAAPTAPEASAPPPVPPAPTAPEAPAPPPVPAAPPAPHAPASPHS